LPCARYALVELGDPEAIDLFLREEDAQAALEDALRDEPGWTGRLTVEPVELNKEPVAQLTDHIVPTAAAPRDV
jgi:hypothetical protein